MRYILYAMLSLLIQVVSAPAAECERVDRVVLGTWPHHLGTFTTHVAETEGFFKTRCLEVEIVSFKESSHFDTTLQRGAPGATFIFNDLSAFTSNVNRVLETGEGEQALIVGYAADSSYGIYGKTGAELGDGSKIAVFRCGWKNRDLREPIPAAEKDETLSVITLNILPWLRAEYGDRMGIWCGDEPPEDFYGIHLVPVGSGSKRERAQADGSVQFAVHAIERATKMTVGENPELTLVAGPEVLRRTPESMLFAATSCVEDESCRDVLMRFNAGLEQARSHLREGGSEHVSLALMEYAANADGGSIKNLDTEPIATMLTPYVYEHMLSPRILKRSAITQIIEDNEWDLEVEDLVAEKLVTME